MPPVVSIVVPAFNAVDLLPETLQSISAQTYKNWEVIVVEDASDDGTALLVQKFGEAHPEHRVVYQRQTVNRGQGAARNSGFQLSQGEVIAFLDSDDIWSPDHLTKSLALLEQRRADLVYAGFAMFTHRIEEARPAEDCHLNSWGGNFPANLYVHNFIQPSAAVFRRSAFSEAGGFSEAAELRGVEDIDLWLRMAGRGVRFVHLDQTTVFYRKHSGATTTNVKKMATAKAHAWFKNRDTVRSVPFFRRRRLVAIVCERAARAYRRTEPAKATSYYGMAWCAWPLHLKYLLFFILCGVFRLHLPTRSD